MAEFLKPNDKRTKYCGEFTAADIGCDVCVMGWVQRQRDLGSLIFIDLRDRSGIIQLAFDSDTDRSVFDTAFGARAEYVLCAKGKVRSRGAGAVNKDLPTGEVEIFVADLKILSVAQTPPFEIVENSNVRPELRLTHRYLDLRRSDMQNNIIARHNITRLVRQFFADNGFLDIETPCLIKPTPEGARDYLVPSRVHPGSFYALPQSPQLYKQLLMLSGFDRYMQIARCFRDEDLRADRQPEFTQIDIEMGFVTQRDIMDMMEAFLKFLFWEFKGIDIETPMLCMTYEEAMTRFGSDKPDLRFGFEIADLTDIVKDSGFKVFSEAPIVRAINIKGAAGKFSRKDIDALTVFVKAYKAKGLAWYKNTGGEFSSSYAKFLTDDENNKIAAKMGIETDDLVFIIADKKKIVLDSLGALRCEMAKRLNLTDPFDYKLLWVIDFPLFEYDEDEGKYYATHHPFTMPMVEDLEFVDTDPGRVRSMAYDVVI
ncbi:MAG: aspartate--tRNA ligase, partial [Oscillospiraceae bacterium]|nr:aspartate--tRNA ligase [Oscillospiraceae bacterium]